MPDAPTNVAADSPAKQPEKKVNFDTKGFQDALDYMEDIPHPHHARIALQEAETSLHKAMDADTAQQITKWTHDAVIDLITGLDVTTFVSKDIFQKRTADATTLVEQDASKIHIPNGAPSIKDYVTACAKLRFSLLISGEKNR